MPLDITASAILTASITGAGLVLAIYTLIVPLLPRIIKTRRKQIQRRKEEFTMQYSKITPESSEKETKQLILKQTEIRNLKNFPKYLGLGVILSFLLYILALIFAFFCFIGTSTSIGVYELSMIIFFCTATITFAFTGIYVVIEVVGVMKEEWKELEEKKEEAEKTIKEQLEELKKEIEPLTRNPSL